MEVEGALIVFDRGRRWYTEVRRMVIDSAWSVDARFVAQRLVAHLKGVEREEDS